MLGLGLCAMSLRQHDEHFIMIRSKSVFILVQTTWLTHWHRNRTTAVRTSVSSQQQDKKHRVVFFISITGSNVLMLLFTDVLVVPENKNTSNLDHREQVTVYVKARETKQTVAQFSQWREVNSTDQRRRDCVKASSKNNVRQYFFVSSLLSASVVFTVERWD